MKIDGRPIGNGSPCFVIAEAGSNHDGDRDQALRLVDVAADAGADAVKFQLFTAEKIAAPTKHPIAQISVSGASNLFDLYKMCELPPEWLPDLKARADERNLTFMVSPFDNDAVDFLDRLGVPAYKIASFELVHLPLLRHVGGKGKPVVLSTGMADLEEIEEAIEAVKCGGAVDVALLHCATNYPARFESVNLAAMGTMKQRFRVPVGFSDHTTGISVPIAAAALGADLIEKHYTVDSTLPGPDHSFALNPEELCAMVRGIREAEAAIGSESKQATEDELEHRRRGRRSLFAKTTIPAGTKITEDMISVLRPGIGLAPRMFEQLLGRTARRTIEAHEPILEEDI